MLHKEQSADQYLARREALLRRAATPKQRDEPSQLRKLASNSALHARPASACTCFACQSKLAFGLESSSQDTSRNSYQDKFFAYYMSQLAERYQVDLAPKKAELFKLLPDDAHTVLEAGIGGGPNLQYYANKNRQVIGLDINKYFLPYVQQAVQDAGMQQDQFQFIESPLENIPLPDQSVDAVVATAVLCSVADVDKCVQEIKRVLRPGGSYVFTEHTAAPNGTVIRLLQSILDPVQRTIADGCHFTREQEKNIRNAGFMDIQLERFTLDSHFLIGPHIMGVAKV